LNIKVVFCEGAHDVAYIEKILLVHGYHAYRKNVKDYPIPLGKMIEQNASKSNILAGKSYRVPLCAVNNDEDLVLFHKVDGDKTSSRIIELIKQYMMNMKALEFHNPDGIDGFKFYIFNDADDYGVEERIELISQDYCDTFNIPKDSLKQGEICTEGDIFLGVYVFFDPDNPDKKGVLEDQLLKMMKDSNEDIFVNAEKFLKDNKLNEERTKEYNPISDSYVGRRNNYSVKKSLIGVAGQLEFSGVNNTVIIEQSDYIRQADISSSDECLNIYNLISKSE
jgi:hypothetical protein